MVTTHLDITSGSGFLQGIWAGVQDVNAGSESQARNYPDRRLSVCHGGCDETTAGRNPGRIARGASPSDSLLGSLLADSFFGAVFGPLLPVWAQSVDWSLAAEAADSAWLDRRTAQLAPPRASYPVFAPV